MTHMTIPSVRTSTAQNWNRSAAFAVAATFVAVVVAVEVASAAVVYDSGGFEVPRFVAAPSSLDATPLAGQDPAEGPWQTDAGNNEAYVQTNSPQAGLQSVQVLWTAGNADTRWWVPAGASAGPDGNVIRVEVDLQVNFPAITPPATLTHGPRFGIEAYDASGGGAAKPIGGLLVDAAQGTVLYLSSGGGAATATGTPSLSRNAYHQLALEADLAAKTYSVYADGLLLHTEPFVDATASAFSYAPITAIATAGSTSDSGTAYFDNYAISQVPEPAGLALASLAAAGLLVRRRRTR